MIGIVNYGMGNLRSVQKAFERVGATAGVVADAAGIDGCSGLVLPGVGNFADGMAELDRLALRQPLLDYAATGRPLLGVCMGMQLLFDWSEEVGGEAFSAQQDSGSENASAGERTPGLGLLPGGVRAFRASDAVAAETSRGFKIPHMGWNAIDFDPGRGGITAGLEPGCHVYFVHGYYCAPDDDAAVAATCTYGTRFCAIAERGPIWAAQFHPEKSQAVGLRMLANFAARVAGG